MGTNMHEITLSVRIDVFNRKITLFALIASCYIFLSEKRNREREARIDKLEKEIARLKNQKG